MTGPVCIPSFRAVVSVFGHSKNTHIDTSAVISSSALAKQMLFLLDPCGWSSLENRAPSVWTMSTWLVNITQHVLYYYNCINSPVVDDILLLFYLYIMILLYYSHIFGCGFLWLSLVFLFIGSALLACPVTAPGIKEVMVFLPGSKEVCEILLSKWVLRWI